MTSPAFAITSPDDLVEQCLVDAGGNEKHAAQLLRERLQADLQLLQVFVEPLLDHVIRQQLRKARSRYYQPAASPARGAAGGAGANGVVLLARANLEDLLEGYVLHSGVRLGQATREQLIEEARIRREKVAEHLVHVQFLSRVIRAMRSTGKVADVLDNDALRRLMAEARHEVGV